MRHEEAITSYNQALELNPNYPEVHYNIGIVLDELGRYEEAIKSYNSAIKLKPDYAEAYNNLGACLINYSPTVYSDQLASTYLDVLGFQTAVRPLNISTSVITLLKYHPIIREENERQRRQENVTIESCVNLSKIPLLLKIMELCPIPDLEIENLLSNLRRSILLRPDLFSDNEDLLRFQSSLALQCFANEFIYEETDEEDLAIQQLENKIQQSFSSKNHLAPHDIARLASYRSLYQYEWAHHSCQNAMLEKLYKIQVLDIENEFKLKELIPKLKPIGNDVSVAVKNMYEENPFPRWLSNRLEPDRIDMETFFPDLVYNLLIN